ncbi:MarR family winged helix-turn-helix transcriptional regulator [Tateyamaria sp. syn59]|uniref:MarR family winged helix-turn-helix transcriptional regulator n=1 Tax=Tateyamaria sp. syn59 TaxID=2576942 RepID=UPI0011BE7811|nr:MarR family transcriptional regulator [Tateyamaria sp. syn59]
MFFLKELPDEDMIAGVTADLPDVSPTHILTVLTRLRAASVLLRNIEAYLRRHGLSQTQFLAMMMIVREPDRASLSAAEIAARLDISKPVLSKALGSLADKGLIGPATSQPADRRQTQLSLTPDGQRRFDQLLPGYFQQLHAADM